MIPKKARYGDGRSIGMSIILLNQKEVWVSIMGRDVSLGLHGRFVEMPGLQRLSS